MRGMVVVMAVPAPTAPFTTPATCALAEVAIAPMSAALIAMVM
jgi:hypothetical protein